MTGAPTTDPPDLGPGDPGPVPEELRQRAGLSADRIHQIRSWIGELRADFAVTHATELLDSLDVLAREEVQRFARADAGQGLAEVARPLGGGQQGWPARDQLWAALADAAVDRRLEPGWAAMLVRLREAAQESIAYQLVLGVLDPGLRPLLEPEPAEADGRGWAGVRARMVTAAQEVYLRWHVTVGGYAHTANMALAALAAGQVPDGLFGGTRDEGQGPHPLDVEPRAPESLAGLPLLRLAVARFGACQAADAEYQQRFGCTPECGADDLGCDGGPHIPDDERDCAVQLAELISQRAERLADYADAVTWVLAADLRVRLFRSEPIPGVR